MLLKDLRHMAHGAVNYEKQGWAQVGQVDLLWTNIWAKKRIMGCTIEVKVLGILKLEWKQCLVMDFMLSKGKSTSEVF